MKLRAAPEFDFDEWAELYRTDPRAFEARRKALLTIELAKGGEIAGPTARLLAALETRSAGLDDTARMQLAAQAMLDASRELNARLGELSDQLQELATRVPTPRGRIAPHPSPDASPGSTSGSAH